MTTMTRAKLAPLVPRNARGAYSEEDMAQRRQWVEERTGTRFHHVGAATIPAEEMRGNIENPIGCIQMPVGVVGPIQINGEHTQGSFYVPMATTEGALLRSYERGMVTLSRSGGVTTRVYEDSNVIAPTFFFEDVAEACEFARKIPDLLGYLEIRANETTGHGLLKRIKIRPSGRRVILEFHYSTGDAQGMNMISKATEAACAWLVSSGNARKFHIFSGLASEKRASAYLLSGGKGKRVSAGVKIPARFVRTYLHTTPREMHLLWEQTVTGHFEAGSVGFNGHLANGLTAMFIAMGQDVANVVNASVGVTTLELTDDGDLYASINLPSLSIATIGGGVGLGTSRECLESIDCFGSGKACKLAEIMAATLLAGDVSFSAAIASGEFGAAHEQYGRNRPSAD